MTRVSTIFGFFWNSNPNFRSRPVWSEKKLTTIVQNIFQVLSDSFGLMMQMYIPFGSDSTCILSVCYTHITNFGDTSKLSTGEVCILAGFGIVSRNAIFDKGILFTRHLVAVVVGAECELLPSKNNNHNRKFDKFDLSLLFYYSKEEKKMPALGHMNNFFFSFVLDFWMMKRGRPSKFIFYFVQYIHTYDRMPDFKNRWYMAVRKK